MKLKLLKKSILFILIFLSFIPIWIFSILPLADIIIFVTIFIYFFYHSKTELRQINRLLAIISLFAFLSFFMVLISDDTTELRTKTAFGGMMMLLLFSYLIYKFPQIYYNTKYLETLSKYFFYFCLLDLLYLTICLVIYGSNRSTRLTPIIGDFIPFKESALYVYGYILSKCLLSKRWRKIDLFILLISSVVNFAMFYRSLTIVWIVLTIFLVSKSIKSKVRFFRILVSAIFILTVSIIAFQTSIEKNMMPLFKFTQDEIGNIGQTVQGNVTNDAGATRILILNQAFHYFINNPILGNGVGFEDYLGKQEKIFQFYGGSEKYVATFHNQIMGFLVDYGLIGTLFLYYVLIKIWLIGYGLTKKSNLSLVNLHSIYCFLIIYIIYFVSSFTGSRMIPSHTSFVVVLPLWLFITAMITEYNNIGYSPDNIVPSP